MSRRHPPPNSSSLHIAQVLNDLLDPSRTNLRVFEEPGRGVVVEGLHEERVVSAQQALAAVARGEQYRKVSAAGRQVRVWRCRDAAINASHGRTLYTVPHFPGSAARPRIPHLPPFPQVGCTAYNEDSSRSHTIVRLHVEAADASTGRATSATLCLIDLAGSESAKVRAVRLGLLRRPGWIREIGVHKGEGTLWPYWGWVAVVPGDW